MYVDGQSTDPSFPVASGPSVSSYGGPPDRRVVINNIVHEIVRTLDGKKYACVYCRKHSVRTKRGWYVDTRLKCSVCDEALCWRRGCFFHYHEEMNK